MTDRRKVLEERVHRAFHYHDGTENLAKTILDLIEQAERETLEEVAQAIEKVVAGARTRALVDALDPRANTAAEWAGLIKLVDEFANMVRHWRGNTGGGR